MFIPVLSVAGILFRDIFIYANDNVFLFLLVGLPCLQFMAICFQIVRMASGSKYRSYVNFKVVEVGPVFRKVSWWTIGIKRFFFAIVIDGKTRIVSGLYVRSPSSVWVYKDLFDKIKTLTVVSLLIRCIAVLMYLVIFGVINSFLS